jgi:hypothetical protein
MPKKFYKVVLQRRKKSLKTIKVRTRQRAGQGSYAIKLFTIVIYDFSHNAWVFVPGRPFQPSQMFASNFGAYL